MMHKFRHTSTDSHETVNASRRLPGNAPGPEHPIRKETLRYAKRRLLDTLYQAKHAVFPGKKFIITFIFHNMFRREADIALNETHPLQRLTVDRFREFIDYFLGKGYHFISPKRIGPKPLEHAKNILITFDDGYFSSLLAVQVLMEYNIPAIFFITAGNIIENRGFWWDVLYRERSRRGTPEANIFQEEKILHSKRHDFIQSYLDREFGKDAVTRTSDLNRPLSVSELKLLSRNKLITIGNHTYDHVHLPLYSPRGMAAQIMDAQTALGEITGTPPRTISYPYGDYNDRVIDISLSSGLKTGITVNPRCNYFPFEDEARDQMEIGRFGFAAKPGAPIDYDSYRPEFSPYYKYN